MTNDDVSTVLSPLAERALEVLVTRNEAFSPDDLACALGVSTPEAREIARALQVLGQAGRVRLGEDRGSDHSSARPYRERR